MLGTLILGIDAFFLLVAASFLVFHHVAHPSSNEPNATSTIEMPSKSISRNDQEIADQQLGWKDLLLKTPLLASILSIPAFNLALGALNIIIIEYLNEHASNPPFLHGIILSVETIGFLIGGSLLVTILKNVSVEKTVFLAMMGESSVLIWLGLWLLNEPSIHVMNLPFIGILMLWIAHSLSSMLLSVSGSSFVQKHGDTKQLGTVRGLFDVLATAPILLSKLIVAVLIDEISVSIPLLSMLLGLLAMMSTGLFYIIVKWKIRVQ